MVEQIYQEIAARPIIGFILLALILSFLTVAFSWVFRNSIRTLSGKLESTSALLSFVSAPKWPLILGISLVFIGLIVLLLGSGQTSVAQKLTGALFSEFGFAFIIAFVLHMTVDLHAKIENEKQVSKGILSYIYGNGFDDDLFRHIE